MPYLTDFRKAELDAGVLPTTAGDLTYLFTAVLLGHPLEIPLWEALDVAVDRFLKERAASFALFCEVMGAGVCAALEFERRTKKLVPEAFSDYFEAFYRDTVAEYEDQKIKENGDVYV